MGPAGANNHSVAAKFIAYDLPVGFVADLQADLAAIGVTGEEQDEDKREAAGDTEKIRGLIKEGNDLLKILNTSVRNKSAISPPSSPNGRPPPTSAAATAKAMTRKTAAILRRPRHRRSSASLHRRTLPQNVGPTGPHFV
ncbi:MAG: hypothetical protein ACOYMN_17330 [Roseimicrobium sp.]